MNHHAQFDTARGVAAITVLFAHAINILLSRALPADSTLFVAIAILARHAVLVFFLLSGYLITLSLAANIERNGRLDIRDYLAARIARIYPPLVGAILVTVLACAVAPLASPAASGDQNVQRLVLSWQDVPRALLMQQGLLNPDGPLWTLYVEFHIYLVAMCAAAAVLPGKRMRWLVSGALLFALWQWRDSTFIFFVSVWGIGSLAALVRLPRLIGPAAACAAGALAASVPSAVLIESTAPSVAFQLLACVAFSATLFVWRWPQQPRFLVRTGDFSYSVYVLHYPLLLLGFALSYGWLGTSLWRAVAAVTVAVIFLLLASDRFARFFEDQRRFKPAIKAALRFQRTAAAAER